MKSYIQFSIATCVSFVLFLLLPSIVVAVPIGPDKYYLDGEPGDVFEEELTIYGKQDLDAPTTLFLGTVGMEKIGEGNERRFFYVDSNDPNEPANWINLSQTEVFVRPGDTLIIPWTMEMGDISDCTTDLGGIVVSNKPVGEGEDSGSSVDVTREIVSQIHVTTPDVKNSSDCSSTLALDQFYVNRTIKLFNYDKVPFVTVLNNPNDILVRSPKGFVEVFGLGEKITIPFNDEELDVYPQGARRFDNIWIDENYPAEGGFFDKLFYELTNLRIGRYEARLGVTKNVDVNIVATDHFWVIPWRIIVSLLVLIVGGVLIGRLTNRRGK